MQEPNSSHPASHQDLARLRQQHIGRLFQQVARDFSQRALERLQQAGHGELKPFHAELISHLDLSGTRVSLLARRIGATKQTVGEAVAQLEALGYLCRERDPQDARAQICRFTEQGQAFLQDAHRVKQALEQDYARIVGAENFAELKRLLEAILADRNPMFRADVPDSQLE